MKNKKNILFMTLGNTITASSRTRVYNYKPLLEKEGFRVTVIPYNSAVDIRLNALNKYPGIMIKLVNRINHLFKCALYMLVASRYDIVCLQRVLVPVFVYKKIRAGAKHVIFDFDDAIYLADKLGQAPAGKDKFLNRFNYIIRTADRVIVSNESLRERALEFNRNVAVIPTPVDTHKLTPRAKEDREKITIGWIGSPWVSNFIKPLKGVFESLYKEYPFLKIKLVGASDINGWNAETEVKKWSLEDEVTDLQDFDIGIMPLGMDEWCKGKSGYKLLQYMAVGIPCVASAVKSSQELIKDGVNGFLAGSDKDWRDKLERLIKDSDLRARMGMEGRKVVEQAYSYNRNFSQLLSLMNDLS